MSLNRPQVSDEVLLKAIEIVTHHVGLRIQKHGRGAFASNHEGLGVMAEEYHELMEAVKNNDDQNYAEEMIDLAVGGIFGLASKIGAMPVSSTEEEAPKCECVTEDQCDLSCEKDEPKPQFTQVESAAEKARQMMIERAKASGIVISETI